ncbi:MAG TPA: xanthine dehydrogenase family protein molybdopterin-binding subunit [Chloroflexota bacterium]|nr:xanthine dehydrogenase family protein molybdopterin-binding subunit [Chloroflexota bacterium]
MAQSLIGASLKRVEDATLLRGAGRYLDDVREPGTLHLAFVRSVYPHARIRGIDGRAALATPGVVAMLTLADMDGATFEEPNGPPGAQLKQPTPLATDVVRFVGEPVVAVVAESAALAEDATALVEVEYEPLPSVGRIEETMQPGAPKVWDDLPDNVCFQTRQVEGDVDGLFARAAHTVSVRIRRHRVCGVPLEPRGMLARPEANGGLTMWISSQMVQRIRDSLCRALGLDRDTVRVIAPDVGGAFGVKAGFNREELVVAKAALKLNRPVKWVSTRMEDFLTTQQARDQLDEAEGAFDAEGHLLALRIKTWAAVGAYSPAGNTNLLARMILFSAGPYRHRAQDVEVTGLYLNANHSGALRGAGRPEATTLGERIMEAASRKLGIDPVEIRRRNFIQPDEFPWANPGGTTYDSGNYPGLLDHALEVSEYDALLQMRDARRKEGELIGVGLATFVEMTGLGPETGRVVAGPEGKVTAYTGAHSQGQAHKTVFPQIVATLLGVPYASITLVQADTALVPEGTGTFGSRSTVSAGGALATSCAQLKERALALAAESFEVAPSDLEWHEGGARLKGAPGRTMPLAEIARLAARRAAEGAAPAGASADGIEGATVFDAKANAVADVMASGAYVALVSVDPDTGRVKVEKLVAVDDSGTIVNPMIVEGQIHGSMAHGLGEALWERMVYDREGYVLTGSLLDYPVAMAQMVPTWVTGHFETPSPQQPFGAKGAGEAGNIGTPPAIVNAVLDALSPLGVTSVDQPLHDERIWRLIHDARSG